MGWSAVEERHRKKYGRIYVACEAEEEKKFIADRVMEEFPKYDKTKVEQVLDRCCGVIPPPRETGMFMGVMAALMESANEEVMPERNEEIDD